jgi:hypothetical protein
VFGNVVVTVFSKKLKMFLLKIIFYIYVLNRFDALISKIILKKMKKHHFDAFRHKKHFEKQQQPHSQTGN